MQMLFTRQLLGSSKTNCLRGEIGLIVQMQPMNHASMSRYVIILTALHVILSTPSALLTNHFKLLDDLRT